MSYVDAFLLPVSKDKIGDYQNLAAKAGPVWMEHGALSYKEFVIEDGNIEQMIPFARSADAKENETVVVAYILYNSRAHRDEVNAKVMADDRIKDACGGHNAPFDFKRMAYGGFESIVDL